MLINQSSCEQKFAQASDVGSLESQEGSPEIHTALSRKLKKRHVTMISLGGAIGTGLFIGTASSLMNAGPLGLLLSYIFVGTICLSTMLSLGEMIVFLPLPGGFIKLAERFVDPAFAFAIGWNYWYSWVMTLPAELSAATAIIRFWDTHTNPAIWITGCWIVAIGINFLGVGAYGEAEFWFSSVKVITIVGLIVFGIVVDLGGGPTHDRIGFRYWKSPGPFTDYFGFTGPKGHFLGTCSVVTQAVFSFMGTEAVAVAAAEARNPRRNIPKAIRRIYLRILIFYLGGVFVIGLLVPSNNPLINLNSSSVYASPFVVAFKEAGIKFLPSIINAAILTSAWSASSTDLYLASRSLYGLSISASAPRIFSRTTRSGLPHIAVGACSCFALLAYLTIGDGSARVFAWFSGFVSTAGLLTWFLIGVTYLRFYYGMKAQGIDRKTLPFSSRMQPFAGWWGVCGTAFILLFGSWEVFLKDNWSTMTFVTRSFPVVFFPVLYLSAKRAMGAHSVSTSKMDFVTNVAEFEATTYDDPPPKNKIEAAWLWLT